VWTRSSVTQALKASLSRMRFAKLAFVWPNGPCGLTVVFCCELQGFVIDVQSVKGCLHCTTCPLTSVVVASSNLIPNNNAIRADTRGSSSTVPGTIYRVLRPRPHTNEQTACRLTSVTLCGTSWLGQGPRNCQSNWSRTAAECQCHVTALRWHLQTVVCARCADLRTL
jgi:hypothetical protein